MPESGLIELSARGMRAGPPRFSASQTHLPRSFRAGYLHKALLSLRTPIDKQVLAEQSTRMLRVQYYRMCITAHGTISGPATIDKCLLALANRSSPCRSFMPRRCRTAMRAIVQLKRQLRLLHLLRMPLFCLGELLCACARLITNNVRRSIGMPSEG